MAQIKKSIISDSLLEDNYYKDKIIKNVKESAYRKNNIITINSINIKYISHKQYKKKIRRIKTNY